MHCMSSQLPIVDAVRMQNDQHACLAACAQLTPQVWANGAYSQATAKGATIVLE